MLAISSAFTITPTTMGRFVSTVANTHKPSSMCTSMSRRSGNDFTLLAASVSGSETSLTQGKDDDDDEDWEYEEYESLTEQDFYNSEWKVGTVMEGANKIDTTWCRCVVKDGEFVAVWGDNSKGKWNFDAASQFFSISKDSWGGWFGKKIWAGSVEDYYFMEGTVRGWSPISPASVVGQWQAKRLGVDPDEAGTAPWFERLADGDEESDENKE